MNPGFVVVHVDFYGVGEDADGGGGDVGGEAETGGTGACDGVPAAVFDGYGGGDVATILLVFVE